MFSSAYGEVLEEAHGHYLFTINCQGNENPCILVVDDKLTNKKFEIKTYIDIDRLGLIWHGDHLLELIQSFGTEDSYSKFIDYKELKISKNGYSNVIAIDEERNLVAYSGEKFIIVQPIFIETKNPLKVNRDFYICPSVSVSRSDAYFTKYNTLSFEYRTKKDNKINYIKEEVSIPPKFSN